MHGFGGVSALFCSLRGTMGKVVSHDFAAHPAECLLDGGNLDEDVGTVTPLLDHSLHTTHLAFDSLQALDIGLLDRRIHMDGVLRLMTEGVLS